MTLECESKHVRDNMGTHKKDLFKGPALNHQDAQWGLQIWLFGQVLETGKQEVSPSSGEGRKEHRAGGETSHSGPISATLTALKPSWPSVPAQVKKAHSLD